MNRSLLGALLLAGCAPTEAVSPDAASDLLSPQLAPPMSLLVESLVPGGDGLFLVTGATPGDTVFFLRSPTLGTTCPGVLGGVCLDLSQPLVMGSAQADAAGVAVLLLPLPATVPLGATMNFQAAVATSSAYVSPVVAATTGYVCGDDVLSADEDCEDGNLLDGDGCSATCQIETGDAFDIDILGATTTSTDPSTGLAWDDALFLPPFIFPDPYVVVSVDGVYAGETPVAEDTTTASWLSTFDLTVPAGSVVTFEVIDADDFPFVDTPMFTFTADRDDLDTFSGAGPITLGPSTNTLTVGITGP